MSSSGRLHRKGRFGQTAWQRAVRAEGLAGSNSGWGLGAPASVRECAALSGCGGGVGWNPPSRRTKRRCLRRRQPTKAQSWRGNCPKCRAGLGAQIPLDRTGPRPWPGRGGAAAVVGAGSAAASAVQSSCEWAKIVEGAQLGGPDCELLSYAAGLSIHSRPGWKCVSRVACS